MTLLSSLLGLRRDARFLKLPPYLSAICILVGVAWLLLLPLDEYSRKTYISENALLPGQVHTYFGGSEHNVFRAYRHEVHEMVDMDEKGRVSKLKKILQSNGLKTATQNYRYDAAGKTIAGENVYAILQGPRADATEAIVLIASWTTMAGEINHSGVALVLTLARYFKRWSLWSKDIIFVIPGDPTAGPQAWVDAYHDAHGSDTIEALSIKSGALQGALAVEYPAGPWGHRFDKLYITYDGTNGQLTNLDLFNTAVQIANGQMGIGVAIQRMWNHKDSFEDRLKTMLRGMINQGLGHATGPHSSFIPYHVDAITLSTVGDGWHDEMSLGRTVESLFRSLNNLLEHLHQSFFLYLLMHHSRFVSVGTYLPSAMLIAANFSITAIAFWVKSGRPVEPVAQPAATEKKGEEKPGMAVVKRNGMVTVAPAATFEVVERRMFLPIAFVGGVHFLGLLPLYLFNQITESTLMPLFFSFTIFSTIAPLLAACSLSTFKRPTQQEANLIQCFSLLLLGMFLAALATLNFSLSLFVGLFSTPLTFMRPTKSKPILAALATLVLVAASPPAIFAGLSQYLYGANFGDGLKIVLLKAAEGWHVWGLWTQVVVWLVWWPAWFCGAVIAASSFF